MQATLYCLRLSVGKTRNNPSVPEQESTLQSFEKPYRCDVRDLWELSYSEFLVTMMWYCVIGKKAEEQRPKK